MNLTVDGPTPGPTTTSAVRLYVHIYVVRARCLSQKGTASAVTHAVSALNEVFVVVVGSLLVYAKLDRQHHDGSIPY